MARNLADAGGSSETEGDRRRGRLAAHAIPRGRRVAGAAYSRFVDFMKVMLPALAAALVIVLVVWPEFSQKPTTFQIGMARISIEEEEGQKVVNARYTGTDRRNQPYTVTADAVVQGDPTLDTVDLQSPKADITIEGGTWLAVTAPAGQYSKQHQTLELSGGVDVFHDQGYEFRTERALVDFQHASALGDTPVRGQGPFGELAAEGFLVLDAGTSVTFTGKARLVLYPTETGKAETKR